MPLNEGDKLPALTLTDAAGGTIDLARFRGNPLVLYFYPKADTPGCTREAQDRRIAR
jgi:peroxiredoxin Q/BCP